MRMPRLQKSEAGHLQMHQRDYDYRVLNSYEKEMKRRSATKEELTTTIVGQLIFVFILVMLFTLYLSC